MYISIFPLIGVEFPLIKPGWEGKVLIVTVTLTQAVVFNVPWALT